VPALWAEWTRPHCKDSMVSPFINFSIPYPVTNFQRYCSDLCFLSVRCPRHLTLLQSTRILIGPSSPRFLSPYLLFCESTPFTPFTSHFSSAFSSSALCCLPSRSTVCLHLSPHTRVFSLTISYLQHHIIWHPERDIVCSHLSVTGVQSCNFKHFMFIRVNH